MFVLGLAAPAWAQWAYDPLSADPPDPYTDNWNTPVVGAADGDGDGDLDIFGVYSNELHMFGNLDGIVFVGPTETDVSNTIDGSSARIEVADLDLDGVDDLVVHDGNGNELLLSNGDLTYTRLSPPAVFGEALAVGELDGDGKPDLVAIDDTGRVVWHPNVDGTFGALGLPPVNTIELIAGLALVNNQNVDVATGDLDGDGDADILSGFLDVQVVENLGAYAFAPPVVALADVVDNVQFADFDGDGDLDVLSKTNSILAWSANLGGFTFGPLEVLAHPGLFGQAVAADVDGDGDPDIAATDTWDNTLWLYDNLGGGLFAAGVAMVTAPEIEALSAGDLDGDGTDELLALFQGEDEGGGPIRIEIDTDGDGLGDLAEVYEHGTDPSIADHDGGGAPDGHELRVTFTDLFDPVDDDNDADGLTNLQELAYPGLDMNDPDTDHDGLWDRAELEFLADPLVADSDGGGALDGEEFQNETDPNRFDDDWPTTLIVDHDLWPAVAYKDLEPRAVELGDLTNDGELDLVVGSNQGVVWFEQQVDDTFVAATELSLGDAWDVEIADLDGDGDLDVVLGTSATVRWSENDGAGVFTDHALGGPPGDGLAVLDLNGDGHLDVLSADNGPGKVTLYLAQGGGLFDAPLTLLDPPEAGDLAALDIEQDGDLDLAVGGASYELDYENCYFCVPTLAVDEATGDLRTFAQGAALTFTLDQDLGQLAYGSAAAAMEAADLDGDGWTDLVVCLYNQMGWFRNDNGTLLPLEQMGDYDGCSALAIGDREVDGDLDVFVATNDEANADFDLTEPPVQLLWFEDRVTMHPIHDSNGDITLFDKFFGDDTYIERISDLALGDIDGDGDLDLVAAVPGLGLVRWHRNVLDRDGDGLLDEIDLCLGDNASGDADLDRICVLGLDGLVLDCDDSDPTVFTGAPELCDGLANTCSGPVPLDEADDDLDGVRVCGGDCDDGDPAYPGAVELCDGRDNTCAGLVPADELDIDIDGVLACAGDCDDGDPASYPGAVELCDGRDNTCAGVIPGDELDADADGVLVCEGECDDDDPSSYPGATEVCDGHDNACLGSVPADELDADADGVLICEGDCDDDDPSSYAGANEVCDGRDNACLGSVPADELDADADGVSPCGGDCDDTRDATFPGQVEICNDGIDNDCDGIDLVCAGPPELPQFSEAENPEPQVSDRGCACSEAPSGAGPFTAALALMTALAYRRSRRLRPS